jgi:hypothetical protein
VKERVLESAEARTVIAERPAEWLIAERPAERSLSRHTTRPGSAVASILSFHLASPLILPRLLELDMVDNLDNLDR